MGTCEETIDPSLQIDNEINLRPQSNGAHKRTPSGDDDDRGEEDALTQQLENVQLEEESKEIRDNASENEGDVVVVDDDDEVVGGYGGVGADDEKSHPYPLRPHATDCAFYLKTGSCKFGLNCKFNHPLGLANQFAGDQDKEGHGFSEDAGKIECKYYLTPGGCKYGDACRYKHLKAGLGPTLQLNFLGLPKRSGERECPFYMRNGSCGYGMNCRFHHPDPKEAKQSEHYNSLVNGQSPRGIQYPDNSFMAPLQSSRAVPPSPVASLSNYVDAGNCLPYMPPVNSFPQAMPQPQNPGWNQYQSPYNLQESNMKLSNGVLANPAKKHDFLPHHQQQPITEEFPERPGLPECDYYMRTGDCKYKSACRYHHPKSRLTNSALDAKNSFSRGAHTLGHQNYQEPGGEEFPERPGQPECEYFMKTGNCKFKSACRYHHPRGRLPNSGSSIFGVNGVPSRHAPNSVSEPSWMSDKSANGIKKKVLRNPQQLQSEEFPERPGEQECGYYMKTGNCKYKSACRYDHPKNLMSTLSSCALSSKGLPLRPGSKICRHYEQHGTCSFVRDCLFDHPDDYNSSAYPSGSASETPASYLAASVPEPTSHVPGSESSVEKNYVSEDWTDGWVM